MPKGDAPQDYTVQSVPEIGKAVIEGQLLDVLPKGTNLNPGQEVRGWLNPQGKYGPYLKIAEDRQRSNGSNAGEGQIIGWAHTLAAFELAHNLEHPKVVERAQQILAQRESARSEAPPTSSPADQGSANGADSAPASSEGLTGNPPF